MIPIAEHSAWSVGDELFLVLLRIVIPNASRKCPEGKIPYRTADKSQARTLFIGQDHYSTLVASHVRYIHAIIGEVELGLCTLATPVSVVLCVLLYAIGKCIVESTLLYEQRELLIKQRSNSDQNKFEPSTHIGDVSCWL